MNSFPLALTIDVVIFAGIMSHLLVNKIGYRATVVLGGIMAGSGMALSILCTELWHTYLSMGILSGKNQSTPHPD